MVHIMRVNFIMVKKMVKEFINGHKDVVILDNGLKIQLMVMENMNGLMEE